MPGSRMRIKYSVPALAAVLALGGCATGTGLMSDLGLDGGDPATTRGSSNVQAVWRADTPVTVSGRLGVLSADTNQCPLLRVQGEDPYALVGPLSGVAGADGCWFPGRTGSWG